MIKKLQLILIIMMLTAGTVLASERITPEIATAINKYKSGNYTGCIKDLNNYVARNKYENNQVAYYYLGMAYTKAGEKENAEKYYKKTAAINSNNTLGLYAKQGIACINKESACYASAKSIRENYTPLDKFIRAPYGNGLSSDLTKEIERSHLEKLRKDMNNTEELNKYEFKDFKDFSNKKSNSTTEKKDLKLANAKPTDEEVLKAIKVLNDAGLNNIAQQAQYNKSQQQVQQNEVKSTYKPDVTQEQLQQQMQRDMMAIQMASYAQPNVNMLFGNQQQNNNNNNMMNMLPYLMAQQAKNGQQTMTPEAMQAMMFNSMMPNLNFNLDSNN